MDIVHFIQVVSFFLLAVLERNVDAVIEDDISSFIVNGRKAENAEYPWQLSLQRKFGTRWLHTCGAVLISSRFAVTALHCVAGQNETQPRKLAIVAGTHGILPPDRDAQVARVVQAVTPIGLTLFFDVALLVLDRELDLNRTDIAAIKIASSNDSFVGERCFITGWGSKRGQRPVANHLLQEAEMSILSNQLCRLAGWSVAGTQICVWDKPRRTSTCFGDSGGPLVCKQKTKDTTLLVGISSFVFRKCGTERPNVFSRMSIYRTWLRRLTRISDL